MWTWQQCWQKSFPKYQASQINKHHDLNKLKRWNKKSKRSKLASPAVNCFENEWIIQIIEKFGLATEVTSVRFNIYKYNLYKTFLQYLALIVKQISAIINKLPLSSLYVQNLFSFTDLDETQPGHEIKEILNLQITVSLELQGRQIPYIYI